MGLFDSGSKGSMESVEQQIKILATNVEVLNQKLIQDPNAAITPGEAIIKKQTAEALTVLNRIDNTLRASQGDLAQSVTQHIAQLKATFEALQKQMGAFPNQKTALDEQIAKLNMVTGNLDKLDKSWLHDFLEKVDVFNKNAITLNNNLISYHKGMIDAIDHKFAEISENTSARIFKNMLWFIIAIIVLTAVFALVFSSIFK